ncbi:MAG: hypothetical protein NC548_58275 [Lachnospiraceae bacterium]|nr:hypothetical protein [Lachnospiraceae bacterium]
MVDLKKENVSAEQRTAPRPRVNLRKSDPNRPRVNLKKSGYGKYEYLRGTTIRRTVEGAKPHKGIIELGGKTTNAPMDSDEQFERRLKRYEREQREAAEAAAAATAGLSADGAAESGAA